MNTRWHRWLVNMFMLACGSGIAFGTARNVYNVFFDDATPVWLVLPATVAIGGGIGYIIATTMRALKTEEGVS